MQLARRGALEVGGDLVYGRQSTGRLVTVPNYKMLAEAVLFAPASSPYVWHEIQLLLTFESDWRRAEEILKEIGEEIHAEVAPELQRGDILSIDVGVVLDGWVSDAAITVPITAMVGLVVPIRRLIWASDRSGNCLTTQAIASGLSPRLVTGV
mgnify:CR=1 FL=1